MGSDYTPGKTIYELQDPATLNQAAGTVVQNTWYVILPTTANVLIHNVGIGITVANETLEVRWTIDGVVFSGGGAVCNFGTNYYVDPIVRAHGLDYANHIHALDNTSPRTPIMQGKSIQIEVRKTTNNGAGALYGICMYGTC